MFPSQHSCMLGSIMVSNLQFICQAKYNCSTDFSTLPVTPQQSLMEQFGTLIVRLGAIKLVDSGMRRRNNPKMLVTLIIGHSFAYRDRLNPRGYWIKIFDFSLKTA